MDSIATHSSTSRTTRRSWRHCASHTSTGPADATSVAVALRMAPRTDHRVRSNDLLRSRVSDLLYLPLLCPPKAGDDALKTLVLTTICWLTSTVCGDSTNKMTLNPSLSVPLSGTQKRPRLFEKFWSKIRPMLSSNIADPSSNKGIVRPLRSHSRVGKRQCHGTTPRNRSTNGVGYTPSTTTPTPSTTAAKVASQAAVCGPSCSAPSRLVIAKTIRR